MNQNDDIDLIPILKNIINNKNVLFKISIIFSLVGILYSLTLSEKYKSSIIFSPISNTENINSSFTDIANIAGINLNSSSKNSLSPDVYPLILDDIFFKREILKIRLNDDLILKNYLLKKSNNILIKIKDIIFNLPKTIIRLPSNIFSAFSEKNHEIVKNNIIDDSYFISPEEFEAFQSLKDIIHIEYNKRNSYVEIFTLIDNPIYSTLITINVQKVLQKYIIDSNIKSAKEVLNYNIKIFNDKKIELNKIQKQLSDFEDKNKVISTSTFNSQLSKLQNEFNLINSVYQELAKQVEKARIQVTKDTPVFSVIKDAEVPTTRNSPDRALIVLIFAFFGIFFGVIYITFREYFFSLYKTIFDK